LIHIWIKELNACIAHCKLPNYYIIPSLLDEVRPKKLEKQWNEIMDKNNCVGRIYLLLFLPAGIFEGIFVKIFESSHAIEFWRNRLLFCKKNLKKNQTESFLYSI
jgi:hypothetical protein